MQAAFGIVLVCVVIVAALAALAGWLAQGDSAYDQIGRGGLSLRDGADAPVREDPPAVAAAVRDEEIRQMLEARNARRARQGRAPLDVDAELRALERPAPDPALAAEVRQLVLARSARRVRQGKEPLDVEAEVARRLRDLESG
ncbi:MAG: hypothetical protein ACXVSX_06555 [Solirubrobacteraceae bacterium]